LVERKKNKFNSSKGPEDILIVGSYERQLSLIGRDPLAVDAVYYRASALV